MHGGKGGFSSEFLERKIVKSLVEINDLLTFLVYKSGTN